MTPLRRRRANKGPILILNGVADANEAVLSTLKSLVRTVTFDNGSEIAKHDWVAAATGAKVFFADANSSWQRGANENWNGLLRQYGRN